MSVWKQNNTDKEPWHYHYFNILEVKNIIMNWLEIMNWTSFSLWKSHMPLCEYRYMQIQKTKLQSNSNDCFLVKIIIQLQSNKRKEKHHAIHCSTDQNTHNTET